MDEIRRCSALDFATVRGLAWQEPHDLSRHAGLMSGADARRLSGWLQAPYEMPRLKATVEALVSH